MPFDQPLIAEKVQEIGQFLRADGADLTLVSAEDATARITLALTLEGANCAECVLPPDALHSTIEYALQRELHTEFELLIDDPRVG